MDGVPGEALDWVPGEALEGGVSQISDLLSTKLRRRLYGDDHAGDDDGEGDNEDDDDDDDEDLPTDDHWGTECTTLTVMKQLLRRRAQWMGERYEHHCRPKVAAMPCLRIRSPY